MKCSILTILVFWSFYHLPDTQSKVIIGAAVAAGVTAASLAYLYTKHADEPIPAKYDSQYYYYLYS